MKKEIKVLDHGYVKYIDHMGSDQAVIEAARMSVNKGFQDWERDAELLEYLYANKHMTPFECGGELQIEVYAPIFVFRQWHRHRTASINEISARYSELPNECYLPEESHLNVQSDTNKQGRGDLFYQESAKQILDSMEEDQKLAFNSYGQYLNQDVAREIARINLPVSTYSEMYWKMNLHNMFHFLGLRMHSHAQYEIRQYANAMFDLIKPIFPLSCEAFEEYRLNASGFSQTEMEILRESIDYSKLQSLLEGKSKLSKREVDELKQKLMVEKDA